MSRAFAVPDPPKNQHPSSPPPRGGGIDGGGGGDSAVATLAPRRQTSRAASRAASPRRSRLKRSSKCPRRCDFGQRRNAARCARLVPPRPPGARRGAARCRGAHVCDGSAAQCGARGVGGDRQDVGAGGAVSELVVAGCRSVEHPGDHVHAQGRRGDARADRHRAAAGVGRESRRTDAMAGAAGSVERRVDQHDRRVLLRPAARVSARSRTRSRRSRSPTRPRSRGS